MFLVSSPCDHDEGHRKAAADGYLSDRTAPLVCQSTVIVSVVSFHSAKSQRNRVVGATMSDVRGNVTRPGNVENSALFEAVGSYLCEWENLQFSLWAHFQVPNQVRELLRE